MIHHSGIGVVLRNLLKQWRITAPARRLVLCGNPAQLAEWKGPEDTVVRWTPAIYSPAAVFLPPSLPNDVAAWYSPHYATCLRPGVPLVCHVQDVLHITHPTRRGTALYARAYLAALRRRAKFVLTSTRHVKVQLQTLHRFRADRVLISGLGPGFPADAGLDEELPSGLEKGAYLLAVGIVKPHKNWAFLFQRLAGLDDSIPPLAVAGAGRGAAELAQISQRVGYRRLCVLEALGENQLAAVFRNAAAVVHPSIAEGFGLPLIEAMQLGRPVVAADRSPMKEIVGDGGWLFDPDRPASFDEALLAALSEASDRDLAARRIASEYTWATAAAVTAEAIHRAVDEK